MVVASETLVQGREVGGRLFGCHCRGCCRRFRGSSLRLSVKADIWMCEVAGVVNPSFEQCANVSRASSPLQVNCRVGRVRTFEVHPRAGVVCRSVRLRNQNSIFTSPRPHLRLHRSRKPTFAGMTRLSGLQRDVLALYRRCLRAARAKPAETRSNFESFARREFEKNIDLDKKDFGAVEFLLRKGDRQLEMYQASNITNIAG